MAITDIIISQDNKVFESDLMPVHSPLVFLVDVVFDAEYPTKLLVEVSDETGLLETFKAIPYRDVLANTRQFLFVANEVVKGLMKSFDDQVQLLETLAFIEDITKRVTITFKDPDDEETFTSTTVTLIHGARQFGENPNLETVYENENEKVYGPSVGFTYAYFYNNDTSNVITVDTPELGVEFAQDYDDEIFVDYDLELFQINTSF